MIRAALAIPLVVLVAAAPAAAKTFHIGSDLKAKAAVVQSAPVDSAYWNAKLASGRRVRVPRKGMVGRVRFRGRVNRSAATADRPNVVMHVQVLRPVGGGRVKAIVTSPDLKLPFGGSVDRVSSYHLETKSYPTCVHKGDYLALSTSGGFGPGYPNGAEFQMFGSVPGSVFNAFTGAGMDMDGDVFSGTPKPDQELLLQTDIITGKRAHQRCG
jgi:hypothetical protein